MTVDTTEHAAIGKIVGVPNEDLANTKVTDITHNGSAMEVTTTRTAAPLPKLDVNLYEATKLTKAAQISKALKSLQAEAKKTKPDNTGNTLTVEDRQKLEFIQKRVKHPAFLKDVFDYMNRNAKAIKNITSSMPAKDADTIALQRLQLEAKKYAASTQAAPKPATAPLKPSPQKHYVYARQGQDAIAGIVVGHGAVDSERHAGQEKDKLQNSGTKGTNWAVLANSGAHQSHYALLRKMSPDTIAPEPKPSEKPKSQQDGAFNSHSFNARANALGANLTPKPPGAA